MTRWLAFAAGICFSAIPAGAAAQDVAKNLAELRFLVKVGDTVTVTDAAGVETTGRISEMSPSALGLRADDQSLTWSGPDITTISARRGDPLGNGALWGFGVGAGLMTLALASGGADAGWYIFVPIYGGLGTAIGVGVDALITRRSTIYDPTARPVSMRFAPLLGGGRKGVVIRFGF